MNSKPKPRLPYDDNVLSDDKAIKNPVNFVLI